MANKEKNTKEEPYLLNDEELDEVEDVERDVTISGKRYDIDYDPATGKFRNPEDFEKYKEKINDMEPKDSDKLTVSDDGESAVIDTEPMIDESKKKINLSESEIMSILEEPQSYSIKKSELIKKVKENLISEARMNDNVRQNFESGENDYNDILGQELTNQLAQEAFQDIADDIRRKTGKQNVSLQDVQSLLGNSLMAAAKEEYRIGTEGLERKAVDMIRKQYNIPVEAVEFDAKIVGLPPQMLVGGDMSPQQMEQLSNQAGIKVGKINREGLKMSKGDKQPPEGKTNDELKPQIKRRRLTNAMMHGAARKSQNLHHLDDQLRQENPQLGRNYANLMAANDANYFLIDDDTIKSEGESGIHAGNVRIDLSNPEKPKVIAQGMVFPILLHELSKGVVELMSLWGLPEDAETRRYVLDKTDNLSSETNDIRLGTKIWERFVSQIPFDNQEVISLTWNMLQELPDTEYNQIIEGLVQNSADAEQKVRRMSEEALEELRKEASEDAFGGYDDSPEGEDDGDTLTPPEEEGGEVGLRPEPEIEEPSEPDYERMSKREIEREIDSALDVGDMDLVRHLGSILNSK